MERKGEASFRDSKHVPLKVTVPDFLGAKILRPMMFRVYKAQKVDSDECCFCSTYFTNPRKFQSFPPLLDINMCRGCALTSFRALRL